MSLERRVLAKVDRRLLSELDHSEGTQLVKVPVSDAVWSTWRRYCDLAGVTMGRGLSILLQGELAAVADEDVEGLASRIEQRESEVDERARELSRSERELELRRCDLAIRESEVGERQRDLETREHNAAVLEHSLAQQLIRAAEGETPTGPRSKLGRNERCWCGSGEKYKNCHLLQEGN